MISRCFFWLNLLVLARNGEVTSTYEHTNSNDQKQYETRISLQSAKILKLQFFQNYWCYFSTWGSKTMFSIVFLLSLLGISVIYFNYNLKNIHSHIHIHTHISGDSHWFYQHKYALYLKRVSWNLNGARNQREKDSLTTHNQKVFFCWNVAVAVREAESCMSTGINCTLPTTTTTSTTSTTHSTTTPTTTTSTTTTTTTTPTVNYWTAGLAPAVNDQPDNKLIQHPAHPLTL